VRPPLGFKHRRARICNEIIQPAGREAMRLGLEFDPGTTSCRRDRDRQDAAIKRLLDLQLRDIASLCYVLLPPAGRRSGSAGGGGRHAAGRELVIAPGRSRPLRATPEARRIRTISVALRSCSAGSGEAVNFRSSGQMGPARYRDAPGGRRQTGPVEDLRERQPRPACARRVPEQKRLPPSELVFPEARGSARNARHPRARSQRPSCTAVHDLRRYGKCRECQCRAVREHSQSLTRALGGDSDDPPARRRLRAYR
jgi:hypothetical protein